MASIEVKAAINPKALAFFRPQLASLGVVFSWELARLLRLRMTWLASGGVVAITALAIWQMKIPAHLESPLTHTIAVLSLNSPWGLLLALPSPLLFLFGLGIPFIFARQVSRELKLRTHELVMTTFIPGWAFIIGRYLAGLVVSLGLAILGLCTILATGLALHQWEGQPPVPVGPAVGLWAIVILPGVLLFSGLSSGLAAWRPQLAGLVIALVVLVWCLSGQFLSLPPYSTPWYATWDPTANMLGKVLDRDYRDAYTSSTLLITKKEVVQEVASRIEQQMPDLGPWLLPQFLLSGLGVLAAGTGAWRFKRFANCLR